MPRVATCKDCGARFKVPDSTTATRAKCKTCGGVLEIPPAEGAAPAPAAPAKKAAASKKAPAARRAAGKAAAPAKKAAPARKAAAGKASGKKASAGKRSAGKASSGRRAAGSGGSRKAAGGKGKRRGAASSSDSGSKAGLFIGIFVVVVAAAAGGWWFFLRDDGTSTTPQDGTAASGAESTVQTPEIAKATPPTAPPAGEEAEPDKAPAPAPGADAPAADDTPAATPTSTDDATQDPEPSTDTDDSSDDAKAPAPELAKAPAPVADTAKADPDAPLEPLPTLIEFEPLEPTLGSTPEELAEWTALVKELYVDFGGATGRRRKALLGEVRELDTVLSVPAYINSVIGVDIAEEMNVIAMYKLVDDWQKRVGYKPTFSYPADTTRMEVKDQNLRVKVLLGWRAWWVNTRGAGQDQEQLDDYRQVIEKALRERGEDEG